MCLLYLNANTRWQQTLSKSIPLTYCRITHIQLCNIRLNQMGGYKLSVTSVESVLFTGTTHVGLDLPVCQSLPCYKGVGGSVLGSVPAVGPSGRSQVWAVIHRSPTSSLCCYFSHGANWGSREDKGLRRELIWGSDTLLGICVRGKKGNILHSELLIVTLREHTCVGEWEPATPEKGEDLMNPLIILFPALGCAGNIYSPHCMESDRNRIKCLHLVLLVLSIVPAVTGFRH